MIKISVNLQKWGFESLTSSLGIMKITNDGTGTKSKGNYKFSIYDKSNSRIIHSGVIKNFLRLKNNVWQLIYLCLKELYDVQSL